MAANAIGLNASNLVQIWRFERKQEEIIMNRPYSASIIQFKGQI